MDNTKEIVKHIKPPYIFRDIIHLINGANFLVVASVVFNLSIYDIPMMLDLSLTERLIIFLTAFYSMGRLTVEFSEKLINLLSFLFLRKEKIKKIIKLCKDAKNVFGQDARFIEDDNTFSNIEVGEFIGAHEYIGNNMERQIYSQLFSQGFLCIFLFLSFFYNKLFFIIVLFFIFSILRTSLDIERTREGIVKHIKHDKKST